ncbi:ubiquinol-cytochrome c reductase iron-sulfur subunit N-terminal domain-containing protein [Microvirga sp. VF16]|uniref:ubiquinol-cytochrome c reductase iron-sulfur subunit N-terminal domain-containing protein n=1 Tax=Microvirga sp. VF16 TaxID=2807101 RepID=UPI00352FF352
MRRDFLFLATGTMGAVGGALAFISSLAPMPWPARPARRLNLIWHRLPKGRLSRCSGAAG